jgi:hypothetical protein
MWNNWIILAEKSQGNIFCFCPIEGNLWDGDYKIIDSFTIMSDVPPTDANVIAAYHSNGDEAAQDWYKNNHDLLKAMFNYDEEEEL